MIAVYALDDVTRLWFSQQISTKKFWVAVVLLFENLISLFGASVAQLLDEHRKQNRTSLQTLQLIDELVSRSVAAAKL